MAPRAHAVRLVYREQARRCRGQHLAHVIAGELLGGQEDEAGFALPEQG